MRNAPAAQGSAKNDLGVLLVNEIPESHACGQIFTIRATSRTNTIAPPTWTFTG
jgi:hypothetical protein